MDGTITLCTVLGGFFMGSYPVPIKSAQVLQLDAHPVVFQCYKTFWVFVTGWLFVLRRANTFTEPPLFAFSWWAVASAFAWIPSGLCTIAAVPRVGVGLTVVVSAATASLLSFFVFWLALGEPIRQHGAPDAVYYLAPLYLAGVVLGMVGLVASTTARCSSNAHAQLATDPGKCHGRPFRTLALGLGLAVLAGAFSAVQFGTVSAGRRVEEAREGCHAGVGCSVRLREEFNACGSWMASFGVGAAAGTALCVLGLRLFATMPPLHLRELRVPGSAAGVSWCLGATLQTYAVALGGNAVVMPATMACQLITAGAWGVLCYREVRGVRAVCWLASACWTVIAIALLSRERA